MTPELVSLENTSKDDLWIHDPKDRTKSSILTRIFEDPSNVDHFPRPFGIFYEEERFTYETAMTEQGKTAVINKGIGNLNDLIAGNNTWEIS